ncbi:T9SS type A sorting domain-containing protein [Polaribacter sp. Z022]|uniref:T9SS type A sorting domain-containing protein n=1 Tax=Polaribacter sp. Z022 TaxID=2927125 RepID=UPI002020E886|nr:T9SS type A sorting domain-containing protein [Polaribacter sp. Z022]MCL7754255.1 T9SS type A sorting domain-containing protein [Polaribacter sp. Z022]
MKNSVNKTKFFGEIFRFKLLTPLFFIFFLSYSNAQECPIVGTDGVFDPNSDVIITSYHQSMAKIATGVVAWGEDMGPDGNGDATSVTEITPANGYNYTGSIIHFAVSGNSGGQAFLATTTNLYVWGQENEVIADDFTIGRAFDVVDLSGPSGQAFNSSEIFDIHATSDAVFVTLNNGTVWVATTNSNATNNQAVTGNSNTDMTVWQQVQTSLNTPLTGVKQVTGTKNAGYALKEDGTIWAWGRGVSIGDGLAASDRQYATQMNALPGGTAPKYITVIYDNGTTSGLLALGTDKKVYGVGANTDGKLINESTGDVATWTAIKKDATTDLTGVVLLSSSHTSEEWSGAAVVVEADAYSNGFPFIMAWGQNNLNSLADGTNQVFEYPIIPLSFTKGSDDPSSISIGGHAITYFNRALGSICFAGHITNGSTGGLTTGDGSTFECVIPNNVELCGLQSIQPQKDSGTVKQGVGGTAIANVVANDYLNGVFAPTIGPGSGQVTLTQTSSSNAGIVLNTNTGEITVTAAVPLGTYTVVYKICESGKTPENCNSAVAVINVIDDADGDGISDIDDLDDDNDGIKDTDEGCTNISVTGANASSATEIAVDVNNPTRAVDGVNNSFAEFKDNNSSMRVTLRSGNDIAIGQSIFIISRKTDNDANNIMQVQQSTSTSGPWTNTQSFSFSTNNDWYTQEYVLGSDAKYLLITFLRDGGDLEIDNISYPSFTLPCTNATDTDEDGIPDYQDLDSDNDGIPDVIEVGGTDANRDGLADGAQGTTTLTQGIPVSAGTGLSLVNTDGDAVPDFRDIDADNDGIPDNIEGQTSLGYTPPSGIGTGITDANNNGVDDTYESGAIIGLNPVNTDGTDNPDYLDLDSDNDLTLDISENGDLQNVASGIDTDGDGLDDAFDDNNDTGTGYTVNDGLGANDKVTNTTNLETAYNDADGDFNPGRGNLDYRDGPDNDNDGIADYFDIDDDNDGILDTVEYGVAPLTYTNPDFATDTSSWTSNNVDYSTNGYPFVDNNCVTASLSQIACPASKLTSFSFDVGWNNGVSGCSPGSSISTMKVSIGGVNYITIATPEGGSNNSDNATGQGGDALVTASNGANFVISSPSGQGSQYIDHSPYNNWTFTTITVTLASESLDGSISFNWDMLSDDIAIDNITVLSGSCAIDTDNDGIPNVYDLDSDNDGIPDIIEAQTTKDYVAPSGSDSDNDGLDDAFDTTPNGSSDGSGSLGLTPQNTDSTDIPDYLDLDSDNDGIFDVVESTAIILPNDGNGKSTGTFGSNGLNNLVELGSTDLTFIDPNGNFDNTQTDNFIDTDGDISLTGGDVDYRDVVGTDSDGDTIPDVDDLDDDNDGILDTVENSLGCVTIPTTAVNGIGESNGTSDFNLINDNNFTPDNGVILNEVGEYIVIDLGEEIPVNTTIRFTLWRNNNTSARSIRIAQLSNSNANIGGGTNLQTIDYTSITGNANTEYNYSLTNTTRYIQIDMPTRANNRIEIIEAQILTYLFCDSDKDGIPNSLDLDSDNDGIPDVIESGGADIDRDGRADGSVGTTGLSKGVPISTTGGTGNTPTATADGDTLPDYLDIDADNDGIPDNIEGQTSNDYIAPSGVGSHIINGITDANNNGVDDNYENDAIIGLNPVNTDGLDYPDYIDTDADNDGILDIAENGDSNNSLAGTDVDNDGLDDNFDDNDDSTIDGSTVNDGVGIETNDGIGVGDKITDTTSLDDAFGDEDNDFPGTGNLDYRDFPDSDGDGVADSVDLDDDNDGILDLTESNGNNPDGDADGDGIPNYIDTNDTVGGTGDGSTTSYIDLNSDGIPDVYDNDGDGTPNHLDLDSDNDGIPDVIESGGTDSNRDGRADDDDNNANNTGSNGIPTTAGSGITTPTNSDSADGDTLPDYLDIDSDNDGIPDNVEGQSTSGFITPSGVAGSMTDSNNNGLDDNYENSEFIGINPEDTDSDSTPDYLDADSDNDGTLDIAENGEPANNVLSGSDSDGDGLYDIFDENNDSGIQGATVNDNHSPPNAANLGDVDGDISTGGDVDYRDFIGITDSDGDTIADIDDLDDDNDGITDAQELCTSNVNTTAKAVIGVNITFDNWPEEVSWTLTIGGNTVTTNQYSTANPDQSTVNETVNIFTTGTYVFTINDTASDGFESPGQYQITLDGTIVETVTSANYNGSSGTINVIVNSLNTNLKPPCLTADPGADSDNDGTINYKDPDFATANGSSLNANGTMASLDADGDGIPNHLDTDSDNDGCPDAVEGNGGISISDLDDNDGINRTVNTNGIPVGPGTAGNGTTGQSDVSSRNASVQSSECDPCNPASSSFVDTDGDGIGNACDLDDDNDGILDTDENSCTNASLESFGTGTGSPVTTHSNVINIQNTRVGTSADFPGESWFQSSTGLDATGNANGKYLALDNPIGSAPVLIYQENITLLANNPYTYSLYVAAAAEESGQPASAYPDVRMQVKDGLGNILGTINTGTISLSWVRYQFLFTSTTTNVTIEIYNNSADAPYNTLLVDEISVTSTSCDNDGDGIPNSLDLDSDNDGIPDVIEAGGTDADRDGKADGTVGTTTNTNGIPASAGTGNSPTTTDGDTIPDFLDIDADNDGIPDNIEGQPTTGYIAPSGTGTGITDTNNNGLDDNYEIGGFVGLNPENTDGADTPDYIDSDSDEDGISDIEENGSRPDTLSGIDTDGDGLYDIFENGNVNDGYNVNDDINTPNKDSLGDIDDDATTIGDVDYRDSGANGIPMITQIYQLGTEKWIEITNIHSTNSIPANVVKIQLYKDKAGEQTDITPDVTFTITSSINAGESVLFRNTSNVISNLRGTATIFNNNALTDIDGANDIITLSKTTDNTSWANRYDVISDFSDNTSYVRIDETLTTNKTYTESEWVAFIDDALNPYRLLAAGGAERHPHDPLISEIENSNTEANTLLGLHRVNITTRVSASGGSWNNGYPDRSRFVVIDEDYNHTTARLSARKLTVNALKKLSVTDNLLVVTNDILLNGDIRLIDSDPFNPDPEDTDYDTDTANRNSAAQLIQTHTSASLVTGTGRLLIDQNSTVPSKYRYNYIGSPVKSGSGSLTYTVADILKDGTTPVNHDGIINTNIAKNINWISGYDGNISDPISLAHYWIYTYASNGGTRSSWSQKFNNGSIPNADGFIFKGPGRPQNYTYLGIPKDGITTTFVGQNESYLVANPFASSISVKEFIEDNLNSISGTLYFWEHAGEIASETGSEGHNFAGYIGGYATRTINMGVNARGSFTGNTIDTDLNLEAEDATITAGTIESVSNNYDVIQLNASNSSIVFNEISSNFKVLRIRYSSTVSKTIRIKENQTIIGDYVLPATSNGEFSVFEISESVTQGSNITLESLDTNAIKIDYLNQLPATEASTTNTTVDSVSEAIDVVVLNANLEEITFNKISTGVDNLRIKYSAISTKNIIIKENDIIKKEIALPSTGSVDNFNIKIIDLCVELGSKISLASDDTSEIRIDYLNLYDVDGIVSCAPNLGDETINYTEPLPYIAIGQGFFVQGDDQNGGTIEFNNSQRQYVVEGSETLPGTGSIFLKNNKKTTPNSFSNLPVLKIGMNFKEGSEKEIYHRQIGISFSQFTSFRYDKGYDAEIYDIGTTDFYWKFPYDDKKYVISGVPAISENLEVPLEIIMGYSGNVTIKVDEMKNINQEVYIQDKVTGISQEIINGTANFNLEPGTYSDRFVLTFKPSIALNLEDTIINGYTNIYSDNENKQLVIQKTASIQINQVAIYSILGRKIKNWKINEQKEQLKLKIDRQLPTGIYIVKLNTDKGNSSKKIVIE